MSKRYKLKRKKENFIMCEEIIKKNLYDLLLKNHAFMFHAFTFKNFVILRVVVAVCVEGGLSFFLF